MTTNGTDMARWHRLVPLIALTAVLTACGSPEPTDPPAPDESSAETPEEPSDPGSDATEPTETTPEEPDMESDPPSQVFPEEQGSAEREAGEEDPAGGGAPASGLEEEIDMAVDAAAASTGVPREDITVTSAQRVTWNDGSLGCPDADGMYTQALVDGYRIILSVDGQERAYHGQDGQEPFYCANPREPSGGGTVDR